MRVPENADRDFTAGCFVVDDGRVLLVNHSKLGKWLQPGGHVEPGETPDETAVRETREETGIEPEIVEDFLPDSSFEEDAYDLPRPFNINVHRIRDGHWHCSLQFLATVKEENGAKGYRGSRLDPTPIQPVFHVTQGVAVEPVCLAVLAPDPE